MVLSVAAFGKPMSWKTGFAPSAGRSKEENSDLEEIDVLTSGLLPKGHKQTFTYALYMISTHILAALAVPTWTLIFTKKLREIRRSFIELEVGTTSEHLACRTKNL